MHSTSLTELQFRTGVLTLAGFRAANENTQMGRKNMHTTGPTLIQYK